MILPSRSLWVKGKPFFLQHDDGQYPAHNLRPSLPRLPRNPKGSSEWVRLWGQDPVPSCADHGHPVRSRRVSSGDLSLGGCRMLIVLQLEHADMDNLPGDQGARHEPDEIRCAVQDPAANTEKGKRWEGAKV